MSRSNSLFPKLFCFLSAMLLAAAAPSVAHAQAGRVSGTVTDSSHAPLAGTQITIVGTRMSTVSDGSGHYSISGVPAGSYTVRVQRIGQRAKAIENVTVTPGQTTNVDVSLATVPLSLGGAHDIDNIAAACVSCNSSKCDTPLEVWLATRTIS